MFRLIILAVILWAIGYPVFRLVMAVRERKAALAWEKHKRERDERWANMLTKRAEASAQDANENQPSSDTND